MATLYTLRETNIRKTWLYMTGFFILIVAFGWVASYYFQDEIVLWFAFGISLIMSFSSYWFSDKVVMKMSGARLIEKKDNPELYRIVENLSITAGLPIPKIYIINDPSPNAFATGRNPEHAAIAVTMGLLEKLERVELEGVIAHELAHIGNHDTLLATVVVVLVGLVIRTTDIFLRSRTRVRNDEKHGRGGPVALISLLFFILAPILAQLLKLAISRKREFLADSTGTLLTRYPQGLISALEKISSSPDKLRRVSGATAHLYIVNPLMGANNTNWLAKLFMTHPPIEQRIIALRDFQL